MPLIPLEEIRAHLQHYNLKAVERETGITYATLWKIVTGCTKNPGYETFIKLSDYVNSKQVKVD